MYINIGSRNVHIVIQYITCIQIYRREDQHAVTMSNLTAVLLLAIMLIQLEVHFP